MITRASYRLLSFTASASYNNLLLPTKRNFGWLKTMDTATVTESEMGKTNSKQYTLDDKERRYHITRKDVSEEVKSNRGNSISKPSTPIGHLYDLFLF